MGKIIRFNKRTSEAVAKQGASPVKRNVAAFAADADGEYVFVNGHWSRLAGVSQSSALGQGWLASVHPDDRGEVAGAWASAVRGERYFGLSYRLQGAAAGEARWVLNQAVPQHNDDGELAGYGGTIIDLARLPGAPRGAFPEPHVRAVLDLLSLCYYEQDLVTGEVTASAACSDLIHGAETVEKYDELIHPEDLPGVNRRLIRAIEEGTLFQADYRIAGRDRGWHAVKDYARIIYDASGTPSHAVGFMVPAEAVSGARERGGLMLLCRLAI